MKDDKKKSIDVSEYIEKTKGEGNIPRAFVNENSTKESRKFINGWKNVLLKEEVDIENNKSPKNKQIDCEIEPVKETVDSKLDYAFEYDVVFHNIKQIILKLNDLKYNSSAKLVISFRLLNYELKLLREHRESINTKNMKIVDELRFVETRFFAMILKIITAAGFVAEKLPASAELSFNQLNVLLQNLMLPIEKLDAVYSKLIMGDSLEKESVNDGISNNIIDWFGEIKNKFIKFSDNLDRKLTNIMTDDYYAFMKMLNNHSKNWFVKNFFDD